MFEYAFDWTWRGSWYRCVSNSPFQQITIYILCGAEARELEREKKRRNHWFRMFFAVVSVMWFTVESKEPKPKWLNNFHSSFFWLFFCLTDYVVHCSLSMWNGLWWKQSSSRVGFLTENSIMHIHQNRLNWNWKFCLAHPNEKWAWWCQDFEHGFRFGGWKDFQIHRNLFLHSNQMNIEEIINHPMLDV